MTLSSVSRLAAIYVVALLCCTAIVEGWRSTSELTQRARGERSGETSRRVVGPAWQLDVDRAFAVAAKAYVAADGETYALVYGPNAKFSPLMRRFLPTYLRGELLPATPEQATTADWLLCYGCRHDERTAFRTVWSSNGYAIGRRIP